MKRKLLLGFMTVALCGGCVTEFMAGLEDGLTGNQRTMLDTEKYNALLAELDAAREAAAAGEDMDDRISEIMTKVESLGTQPMTDPGSFSVPRETGYGLGGIAGTLAMVWLSRKFGKSLIPGLSKT